MARLEAIHHARELSHRIADLLESPHLSPAERGRAREFLATGDDSLSDMETAVQRAEAAIARRVERAASTPETTDG